MCSIQLTVAIHPFDLALKLDEKAFIYKNKILKLFDPDPEPYSELKHSKGMK